MPVIYCSIKRYNGAGNGTRTRDIKLGKLALYQLSYSRSSKKVSRPLYAVKHDAVLGGDRIQDRPDGISLRGVQPGHLRPVSKPSKLALRVSPCPLLNHENRFRKT